MYGVTTWDDLTAIFDQCEVPIVMKRTSAEGEPPRIKILFFSEDRDLVDMVLREKIPLGIGIDKLWVPKVMGTTREDLQRLVQ